MKRSRVVTLTILLAIIASACEEKQNDLKHCVDENGVVVEEKHCENASDAAPPYGPPQSSDGGTHSTGTRSGGGGHFWYFGGHSAPVAPGGKVSGGSYTPSTGKSYSPPSVGVSRGGFGSTGAGHGGGTTGGSGGG